MYYIITGIGTHDCSVREFINITEAAKVYKSYITSGINVVLAQELKMTIYVCPICKRECDEVGICWDCDIVGTLCGNDD